MKQKNRQIARSPNRQILWLMAVLFQLSVFQLSAFSQIPCRYDVEIIQAPPCQFTGPPVTVALGISPNGKYVVGYHFQCDPKWDEAFCYDTETKQFVTLPRPAGVYTASATDVNDNGWIVGTYGKSGVGNRGYVYKMNENQWIELSPAGSGGGSLATAINNAGQVCGSRSLGKSSSPYNAFIWSEAEGFTDLGVMNGPNSQALDINENGDVCGWTGQAIHIDGARAFLYQGSAVNLPEPIPDQIWSAAYGLNNASQLVLRIRTEDLSNRRNRTVVWNDGELNELPLPDSFDRSFGLDVTDHGLVVGTISHSSSGLVFSACVWDRGSAAVIRDLADAPLGVRMEVSRGVSAQGYVVIQGHDPKNEVVGLLLKPALVIEGDVNSNCVVNVDDLIKLIGQWGQTYSFADLNYDDIVNVFDLLILLQNWTY